MLSITLILIIVTVLVSIRCFSNIELFNKLKHHPYSIDRFKEYYRLLTSGFVHGDYIHLTINMFVFWQFGTAVEQFYQAAFSPLLGKVYFVLLYLGAIVVANVPNWLQHRDNAYFSSVGASGATSAILFAYVLFLPWQMMYFYGIIPIPGIVAAIAFLGYSSYASRHSNDNIDHTAHFYGAIFGIILTIGLRPSLIPHFLEQLRSGLPF